MSDQVRFEMDTTAVLAALNRYGSAAVPYINQAAKQTADAIANEARARLSRALGSQATGATLAGIEVRPAFDGNGSIVISERNPFPNLPLWIEKGTKKGRPHSHSQPARPYFYVSALLEEGAHVRRVEDALERAAREIGLGR